MLKDSLIFAAWGAIQYGLNYLFNFLSLKGIDRTVFLFIQIAFAVGTVAPICLFVIEDIAVRYYEMRKTISAAHHDWAQRMSDASAVKDVSDHV